MTTRRTIQLSIVRDGPAHNQLLSPLTPYLALCQNRPPESVRLSVEHLQFLRWQMGLSYRPLLQASPAPAERELEATREAARMELERQTAIGEATSAVTHLLGAIRALAGELASDPCEWRHIHMVLDAAELAVLPFELARAAPGLMVEGERLFMQQNVRVTLTRQTRRVATSVVHWPSRPKILFIAAAGALPTDAHALALRLALDPWIGWNDGDGTEKQIEDNRVAEAAELLTILDNPTLDDVARTCKSARFTHVHILAHGMPLPSSTPWQTTHGLAFRGAGSSLDVVDGDRLEAALRCGPCCEHPVVATLATCDGANVAGGILGAGGSVAHALHAKGIPLVVASQFPLSAGASVVLTEGLYKGLLYGEDPRETLHFVRRELLQAFPATHDWASVVMYASLPQDIDDQLARISETTTRLAAETAVERVRVTLRHAEYEYEDTDKRKKRWFDKAKLDRARLRTDSDRLDRCIEGVRAWTGDTDLAKRFAGFLHLGDAAMQLWHALDHAEPKPGTTEEEKGKRSGESLSELAGRAFKPDPSTHRLPISMFTPDELLRLAKESYKSAYYLDGSRWELWVRAASLCWALEVHLDEDIHAAHYMASLYSKRADFAPSLRPGEKALAAAIRLEVELLRYSIAHENAARSAGATDAPATAAGAAGGDKTADAPATAAGAAGGDKTTDAPSETKVDEAFTAFLESAAPIQESFHAFSMYRYLGWYVRWAERKEMAGRKGMAKLKELGDKLRKKLDGAGVRKYWGARL